MNDKNVAPVARRADAVKSALLEQGHIDHESFETVAALTDYWRPENGANVVARAWTDPDYMVRLLENGTAACAELGYAGPQGEYIVALENTSACHNIIVCTQCSCTAWPVLGLPPDWYKSPEYRARVVREPRKVVKEMGLELKKEVSVRVWETSAETRYIVIPMRPHETEDWSASDLAKLVTREAMIGVALVTAPD